MPGVLVFSHPDCTVGFGFSPNQFRHVSKLAGLTSNESYRRSGIGVTTRLTMPRRRYFLYVLTIS